MTADFLAGDHPEQVGCLLRGVGGEKGGAPISHNPVPYPQFVIGTHLCVDVTHTLI